MFKSANRLGEDGVVTTSITGREWEISKRAPRAIFEANPDLPKLTVQLLHNRSCHNRKDIEAVLSTANPCHDPFLMSGMNVAVKRILTAIRSEETICVYADYDADGVSGAAVLMSTLTSLDAHLQSYFPKRLEEGYGLNEGAIHTIRESGVDLLISTDCGANAVTESELAAKLGLDLIVTDHHIVSTDIPKAAAAINPHHPNNPYPFVDLAGVGVAYKLAEALLLEAQSDTAIDSESLLDFVALGTVADVVKLYGENRWMVQEGLKKINDCPRIGMAALIESAGLEQGSITSRDVAFRLGPRINAAGRMGDAKIGLEMLLESDVGRAKKTAAILDDLNRQRQQATENVLDEISYAIAENGPIVAHGNDWPLGVLGLVAGRLVAKTGRPTFISSAEAGEIRGSARGPDGFNVTQALQTCTGLLKGFGGHEHAAGFTLHAQHMDDFRKTIADFWMSSTHRQSTPMTLVADCRLHPQTINFETLRVHGSLEPFGEGFEDPVYVTSNLTLGHIQRVGNNHKHLKLTFPDISSIVSPIWFGMGMVADELKSGAHYDVAFRLSSSSYQGRQRVDLFVEDMRPAS